MAPPPLIDDRLLAQAVPVKRSVTIAGHRSSISLEAMFLRQLQAAAARRGLSLNQLVSQIDAIRSQNGGQSNLSAVLRAFILKELTDRLDHR
ncbi:MAG: ribbon-helix-helix domain-containing protein [Alphaproteobacteria bacterium]|nr:ribbon-helix-helix domain-containing protein [Alphaproteobacteria bacterium]